MRCLHDCIGALNIRGKIGGHRNSRKRTAFRQRVWPRRSNPIRWRSSRSWRRSRQSASPLLQAGHQICRAPGYGSGERETCAHSSFPCFIEPIQRYLVRLIRTNYRVKEQLVLVRESGCKGQRIVAANADRHGGDLVARFHRPQLPDRVLIEIAEVPDHQI